MRHSYLFIIAIMLAVMTPRIAPAQSIAVKSNVLYDLTGTLNLGGEIRCDDTWKSHATLTLLAKQDCPLWLQYD